MLRPALAVIHPGTMDAVTQQNGNGTHTHTHGNDFTVGHSVEGPSEKIGLLFRPQPMQATGLN